MDDPMALSMDEPMGSTMDGTMDAPHARTHAVVHRQLSKRTHGIVREHEPWATP